MSYKRKSPAQGEAISKIEKLSDLYSVSEGFDKPKVTRRGTKSYLLLERLVEEGGGEVSLRDLMFYSHLGAVHSAVATLRAKGWDIRNRSERNQYHTDGSLRAVHSWYRIIIPTTNGKEAL